MKFSKDSPVSCFENEYLVCSLRILEMHFYIRFLLFLAFDIIEKLYFNRHINTCHCFRAIKGKVIEENYDILMKTEVFGVSKKKTVVVSLTSHKIKKDSDYMIFCDWPMTILYFFMISFFKTEISWWKLYIYEIIHYNGRHCGNCLSISLYLYIFLSGFFFHMIFANHRAARKGGDHF